MNAEASGWTPEKQMDIRVRRRQATQILRIQATDREDRQLAKFLSEVVVPGLDELPYDWEVEDSGPNDSWTAAPTPGLRLDLLEGQVSGHSVRLDRLANVLRSVICRAVGDAESRTELLFSLALTEDDTDDDEDEDSRT